MGLLSAPMGTNGLRTAVGGSPSCAKLRRAKRTANSGSASAALGDKLRGEFLTLAGKSYLISGL